MHLCGHTIRPQSSLFAFAGPCVIESEEMTLSIAETLAGVADRLGLLLIFKASFDKANRSSDKSFRGLGIDEGLRILEKVRAQTGLPVITDVHEAAQVAAVASVVDVLQTPAFLARQTDFIAAVAASGKPVNIKKAQFMAPADMQQVVNKARNAASAAGHDPDAFLLCERGTSFGYNTLVSDMRGLAIMADTGCPVVFDATHSVQQPGGLGERSGGQREFVPLLARAAVAAGVAGVFMETHPDPDKALSDGPNALPLADFEELWKRLLAIDAVVKAA
ncbi:MULTISPECIES: 3-deoxy-8-phosphooctulonate synthase [unclassified Novosphingobium]|uniref:3-deoxy-8-phosphooctulonate synthase n=1 Tax=unclassified Novosphingobium TaxID=2644732 RepID=UPI000D3243EA|nr:MULTISPECIES: 3-deoxy-8-phosphooctulonate synthase [unclassified Novosphingobium]PTR10410.1 2-dehydro-3-deoxyphosphooctonate aldolase (KDO 8-P synthase) [Novosphingobium sp. GV055]PUB03081.1 2-dehydro-3-deoxyphosphooctonate aldolase (KDO 8-P synthase) [Novosphingobium sp. GV061]PUB19742.1 2-dehydro-3-deoxyphosphooctonate aldolase (KDO 8-P synthase) [Novosphingobium sp. GV079]PUB41381.1 2-dehydro-3-deoxyphosphooctonate aldolase (KDO 8-P synthase) [Novosphingobium sp. GV027]